MRLPRASQTSWISLKIIFISSSELRTTDFTDYLESEEEAKSESVQTEGRDLDLEQEDMDLRLNIPQQVAPTFEPLPNDDVDVFDMDDSVSELENYANNNHALFQVLTIYFN